MTPPPLPPPIIPPPDDSDLPSYLRDTDPLELEHIPLQVALLTMELAQHHQLLKQILKRLSESDAPGQSPGKSGS